MIKCSEVDPELTEAEPVSRNPEFTQNNNQMQNLPQSQLPYNTAQNDGFEVQTPDFGQENIFTAPPGPPPMPPPQDQAW